MDPVLVAIEAGVQRITLNRPQKLNAFNPAVQETQTRVQRALVE